MSIAAGHQHRVPGGEGAGFAVAHTSLCHMGALAGALAVAAHRHVEGCKETGELERCLCGASPAPTASFLQGPSRVLPAPLPSPSAPGPHPALCSESLTVQVAAGDGRLLTPALGDHQEQQAGEQGLGGRHGHLKQWADMSLVCAGGRFQVHERGRVSL